MIFTYVYLVLMVVTEFYLVIVVVTEFSLVLEVFSEFYLVQVVLTEYYLVLVAFTRLYLVSFVFLWSPSCCWPSGVGRRATGVPLNTSPTKDVDRFGAPRAGRRFVHRPVRPPINRLGASLSGLIDWISPDGRVTFLSRSKQKLGKNNDAVYLFTAAQRNSVKPSNTQ